MTEQDRETAVGKLQRQTGSKDAELLSGYIDDAQDAILDMIDRDFLPPRLLSAVTALAEVMYNQQGSEGIASRSEGGVSQSYLDALPAVIRERLKNYPRKARVVGNAPES